MKRLTERWGEDDVWLTDHDYVSVAHRLAEYEDTGLDPEKIVFLKNVVDDAFSDKPEFTEHSREKKAKPENGSLPPCSANMGSMPGALPNTADKRGTHRT